jgi:hypothetical protein
MMHPAGPRVEESASCSPCFRQGTPGPGTAFVLLLVAAALLSREDQHGDRTARDEAVLRAAGSGNARPGAGHGIRFPRPPWPRADGRRFGTTVLR